MPYCPNCRSEFVETATHCPTCDVDLVPALAESDLQKGERLREAADAGKASRIAKASYSEIGQMVELLQANGIDAMLVGDEASCGKGGHCGYFYLAVLPEDVPAASNVLHDEFCKLVEISEECRGANPDAVLDFDTEGPRSCPACGAKLEGTPEECPDCGLFIGVSEG